MGENKHFKDSVREYLMNVSDDTDTPKDVKLKADLLINALYYDKFQINNTSRLNMINQWDYKNGDIVNSIEIETSIPLLESKNEYWNEYKRVIGEGSNNKIKLYKTAIACRDWLIGYCYRHDKFRVEMGGKYFKCYIKIINFEPYSKYCWVDMLLINGFEKIKIESVRIYFTKHYVRESSKRFDKLWCDDGYVIKEPHWLICRYRPYSILT